VVIDQERVGNILRHHCFFLGHPVCLLVVLSDVLQTIYYKNTFALRALGRFYYPIVV